MISNKTIFYISFIIIVLIITIPTVIKVKERHVERLLTVETAKIKESSLKCYIKKDCKNEKITLEELIFKNYIKRGIDPRTEEYFKDDVYVIISDKKAILHIDNEIIK